MMKSLTIYISALTKFLLGNPSNLSSRRQGNKTRLQLGSLLRLQCQLPSLLRQLCLLCVYPVRVGCLMCVSNIFPLD